MAKRTVSGKEELLKAAHSCFGKDSYERVGVAQLLGKANLQAPTLYHHFGDKEGLYVAWCKAQLSLLEANLTTLTDSSLPVENALQAVCSHLMKLEFDLRALVYDAQRLDKPENKEEVLAAYLHAVYSPIYAILSRAHNKGLIPIDASRTVVETFVAGALAQSKLWRGAEAANEGAAWWTKLFLAGIR